MVGTAAFAYTLVAGPSMSVPGFVGFLVVGGALLAWWVDERLPGLRPANFVMALFRALLIVVAAEAIAPGEQAVASVVGHAFGSLLVTLPGFMLMFLACVWMVRAIQRRLAP